MTTLWAIAPKASSPPPPIPLPVGGGSILLRVQVPEKLAFVWPFRTPASITTSTTENSPTGFIMVDSSVGVDLRHQRLRAENVRRISAGPRNELLRTAAKDFRGVQVSIRIGREFVYSPEQAGCGPMCSPGIEQFSIQIVFEEFVDRSRKGPQIIVGAHADRVGLMNVRPDVEELAVLVEDLNAVVGAIGDVDAPVAIGSDGVGSVELSWSGSGRSPCHQVLSVLVELHNARVAVTVADEERAVRQPGHVGRPFEMLIVSTGFIAFPERHQQLLSIV